MKKLFGNIIHFLGNIFTNVESWVSDHVKPAIEVVNQIKAFVDDATLDVLTQFISGDLDDKAVAWLRKNAAAAIDTLALTAGITDEPDFLKKVKLLILYIRKQSTEKRNGLYLQLATAIAKKSGTAAKMEGRAKVTTSALNLLTQLQFEKMKSGITDADENDTGSSDQVMKPGNKFYSPITGDFHEIAPVVKNA